MYTLFFTFPSDYGSAKIIEIDQAQTATFLWPII